jgi:hypothetical protein
VEVFCTELMSQSDLGEGERVHWLCEHHLSSHKSAVAKCASHAMVSLQHV